MIKPGSRGASHPGSPEAAGPAKPQRKALWFVVAQATSRLSSLWIFSVVAHHTSLQGLGAFAVATAMAAAAQAVAPAMIGKPMATLPTREARAAEMPVAFSGTILLGAVIGIALGAASLPLHGATRLALLGGAFGVPAGLVVEGTFWRVVYRSGPRAAALVLSFCYLAQAVLVALAPRWFSPTFLVVAPYLALAAVALVVLAVNRGVTLLGARRWIVEHHARWLPYVGGASASLGLVQAIPIAIAATSGIAAASTWRAGELAFGATNLVIGAASQLLLVREHSNDLRSVYLKGSALLGLFALVNGIVVALLPRHLVEIVLGPAARELESVLPQFTLQRVATCVASVGVLVLIPVLRAGVVGSLDAVSALLKLGLLAAGSWYAEVSGGIWGLAVAEVLLAVFCTVMLYRRTRPTQPQLAARHRAAGQVPGQRQQVAPQRSPIVRSGEGQ